MILDQATRVMRAIATKGIRLNVMLWGPNGVGKTDGYRSISKELGWEFWIQAVPAMDRSEIAGIPFSDTYKRKNGEEVLVQKMAYPEYVTKAMDGEIIILFDEVNRGPKECQNSLLEFINERSINGKPLSDKILIGLTGNPPDERNHTKQTDTAFNDRVVHILIETNPESTIQYFETLKGSPKEVHSDILSYLRSNPKKLLKFDDRDSEIPVERNPSPRNWLERVNRIWKDLRSVKDEFGIKDSTIDELIWGTLGPEAAHFLQFAKSSRKPLTLKDVLNISPEMIELISKFSNMDEKGNEKVEGQTEMGFFHGVCSEITNKDNQETVEANADKILEFLSIIPMTFSFSIIKSLGTTNQKFWKVKFSEKKVNPETGNPIKDPISGLEVFKWQKLIDIHSRAKEEESKRVQEMIDSKKL